MKHANNMYFGWGNPRTGVAIVGHDIVVLIDGDKACTLQGEAAKACKKDLSALTNHLCGVKKSGQMARLIKDTGNTDLNNAAYNAVFDGHWKDL